MVKASDNKTLKTTLCRNSVTMAKEPERNTLRRIKGRIIANWLSFNLIAYFSLLVFSYFYFLERGVIAVLIMFVILILFLSARGIKFEAAEKNPKGYIACEDFNRILSKIHWFFIYPFTASFVIFFLLLGAKYPVLFKQTSPILTPLFLGLLTLFAGTTFYVVFAVGNEKQQPWLLKIRSKAYFQVLSITVDDPVKEFSHPKIRRFFWGRVIKGHLR